MRNPDMENIEKMEAMVVTKQKKGKTWTVKTKAVTSLSSFSRVSVGGNRRVSSNGRCPSSPSKTHYWMIEPPFSEMSLGVCWYCQEKKEFLNWPDMEFKG